MLPNESGPAGDRTAQIASQGNQIPTAIPQKPQTDPALLEAELRVKLDVAASMADDLLSRVLDDTAYRLAHTARRETCMRSRPASVPALDRTVKTCRHLLMAAMEMERLHDREVGL